MPEQDLNTDKGGPDKNTAPDNDVKDTQKNEDTKDDSLKQDQLMDGDDKAAKDDQDDTLMDDKKDDVDKEEKESVVPEKYEKFDLKDGADIGYVMSDEQHEAFSELAKKLNLSQELAQELIKADIQMKIDKSVSDEAATKAADEAQIKENIAAVRKEHGDKYPEVLKGATVAFNRLYGKEIRELFTSVGLTTNPLFLNTLYAQSKLIGEDSFVKDGGGQGGGEEKFDKYSDIFEQPKVENATDG